MIIGIIVVLIYMKTAILSSFLFIKSGFMIRKSEDTRIWIEVCLLLWLLFWLLLCLSGIV